MIPERLFCVKPDFEIICYTLNPGAAAHPKVHAKWEKKQDSKRCHECLAFRPADEVCNRLKEIHAKEAGDECDGHKEGCDDRQHFHDVIHAVVDNGQISIQRAADEIAQAFV